MDVTQDIFEVIEKRHGSGRIGLAYNYLSTLQPCLDGADCSAGLFKSAGIADWEGAVKASKRQLVYRDDGMLTKGGIWLPSAAKDVGAVNVAWGKPSNKLSLQPNACMDLECIVTTTRKDRDGDVLETEGAEWGDPPTPFLWQHMPMMPIGKVVRQTGRTKSSLSAHCSIADTELGRDAAFLIDFGALGISHGFKPLSVESLPKKHADDGEGFRVKRFRIVEVSAVSVRSNEDAIITAASRDKLHHPLIKAYAKRLKSMLPAMVVGGFDTKAAARELAEKSVFKTHKIVDDPNGKIFPLVKSEGDTSIRWNRRLSKAFDVAGQKLEPSTMTYDWCSQYLEVPVKHISVLSTQVPSVRMGTFLTGLKEMLKGYHLDDVRNLSGTSESPPLYETIQLNSKRSDTFLVNGTAFYKGAENGIVVETFPLWGGVGLDFYIADDHREKASDIIDKTWEWAKQNNFLKGEAFALSGEFLTKTDEDFDGLFLEEVNQKAVSRVLDRFNAKGKAFNNHGMIFSGPPGTGKTLSCRVLLNKAEGTYLWVSARDFYRMGSFGGMAMAFDMAKELSPAIIVLEDADNWIDRHTVDYLKSEMDGVGRSKGIMTILTTNFPETLPEALIDRPGRFHDVLQFALPTKEIRQQMLTKWLDDLSEAAITQAAADTEGYSGAHLFHLARFAMDLQESESVEPEKSLAMAIEKVKQQKDLIDGIQLEGSHYRPSKDVAEILSKTYKGKAMKNQCGCSTNKSCEKCAKKSTPAATPPVVETKGCKPVVVGRKRHSWVEQAVKNLDEAHDHKELEASKEAKTLIRSAQTLIKQAVKPPESREEEEDEDEDGKKVEYTLLKDGKKVEYTILKDNEARCSKCGGAVKDGNCTVCGQTEANPEAGPEANPGIGKSIDAEVLATHLLAKFYVGKGPAWDTLHALKGAVEQAIEQQEQAAAIAICA